MSSQAHFFNPASQIAPEHKIPIDKEAVRLVALAAEMRVRSVLISSIRAQEHRVNSTFQQRPPLSKPSGSGPARALWSHRITSDPNAVMVALGNANREENKAHRVARTERNARETEIARATAAARDRDPDGSVPPTDDITGGAGSDSENPTNTTMASSLPGPSRAVKEPALQSTPTFGAVQLPKKTGKSKKTARNVSAEVQAKITNATAGLSAGRKVYAWEMGAASGAFRPQVPSLLSGKRKRGDDADGASLAGKRKRSDDAEGDNPPNGLSDAEGSIVNDSTVQARPPRAKRALSGPHRRQVDVHAPGDKRSRDDTALTVVDLVFALEHEGSGRGMGTADEIIHRVWARPGGPYGRL